MLSSNILKYNKKRLINELNYCKSESNPHTIKEIEKSISYLGKFLNLFTYFYFENLVKILSTLFLINI